MSDWDDEARTRLEAVLGLLNGEAVYRATLTMLTLPSVGSADELLRFGTALTKTGGFAVAAVGALLVHYAVQHGAIGSAGP